MMRQKAKLRLTVSTLKLFQGRYQKQSRHSNAESRTFDGTIRDNMKWGKENATDSEIFDALEEAQALDLSRKRRRA